jgi:hypothetical protein
MSSASSSPSSSSPIWLDCDPGHDDFFALLLAAASPPSRLTGVSTVHGNQSVAKTTHNALVALHVARLVPGTVPVLAGSASALLGAAGAACPEVHGESGLDCGVPLPQPTQRAESTDNFLLHWRNALLASKDKVALVATGALTNVALLLLAFPEVKANLASITVLGGAWGVGNMSPDAEWNIMVDPHAALVVFNVSAMSTFVSSPSTSLTPTSSRPRASVRSPTLLAPTRATRRSTNSPSASPLLRIHLCARVCHARSATARSARRCRCARPTRLQVHQAKSRRRNQCLVALCRSHIDRYVLTLQVASQRLRVRLGQHRRVLESHVRRHS